MMFLEYFRYLCLYLVCQHSGKVRKSSHPPGPLLIHSAQNLGGKKIYPLLLIYAVEAATTTLPCLVYILSLPPPGTGTTTFDSALTFEQRLILLSGYAPFFLVPLIMLLDIGGRVYKLVSKGLKMEAEKWE